MYDSVRTSQHSGQHTDGKLWRQRAADMLSVTARLLHSQRRFKAIAIKATVLGPAVPDTPKTMVVFQVLCKFSHGAYRLC